VPTGRGAVAAAVEMALESRSMDAAGEPFGGRERVWTHLSARRIWIFATGWLVAMSVGLVVVMLVGRPSPAYATAIIIGQALLIALVVFALRRMSRDVAERMQHEQEMEESEVALRESEARYRSLIETQVDVIVRWDHHGAITFANDCWHRMTGVPPGEESQPGMADLVHVDDLDKVKDAMRAITERGRSQQTNRVRTVDGWRWFEWDGGAITDDSGAIVEFQGVGRDVTERVQVEEALRTSLADLGHSEEQLRLLAQRQVTIRDEERKRLGLDLHDDVCQEIVGIGIMLESIRSRVGEVSAETAGEFDRMGGYLGKLVDHLRLLARELQPLQLHALGLQGSLRTLGEGMSTETCLVAVRFPTLIPRLAEDAEVGVYRIAQEALTNAVRHANAATVELVLTIVEGRLRLEVSDDGRGFDPGDRTNALGLVGMEERALSLGGRLSIRSRPDEGTTVCLECPFDGRTAASAA